MTNERLESVLDGLMDSYSRRGPLNNLETAALPNRRAIVQALTHLQHLLFLGFYTTQPLEESTLRLTLGSHLLGVVQQLGCQIHRAAAWEDRDTDRSREVSWSNDVVAALLAQLPDLREALHEDVEAAFRGDPAAESREEVVFCYPGVFALTAYRVANRLFHMDVPLIPRILTEHAHNITGIDIHPGATIGRRFFVDHGTGVIIGATSVVGDDVRLYHGVTLGALSVDGTEDRSRKGRRKRHPTIGDRVVIYTGSTILGGNTTVGHDSVIGGNVWLTSSVPPHSRILYRPEH